VDGELLEERGGREKVQQRADVVAGEVGRMSERKGAAGAQAGLERGRRDSGEVGRVQRGEVQGAPEVRVGRDAVPLRGLTR
jgi:hypothetical protein